MVQRILTGNPTESTIFDTIDRTAQVLVAPTPPLTARLSRQERAVPKHTPHNPRKQSPEHVAKRMRYGEDHWRWLGESVSTDGGRSRALRMYPDIPPCEMCGDADSERHHRDGNTANNAESNIQFLCRHCHMTVDGRIIQFRQQAKERSSELIDAAAKARRARTSCKRGHPLSGDNLYINPQGSRVCKTCRAMHSRNYAAKKEHGHG